MLTVDFERFDLQPGHRLLDLGCGGGRHAFEAMRRGAAVIALDYDAAELKDVRGVDRRDDRSRRARTRRRAAWSTATRSSAVPRRHVRPRHRVRGAGAHLGRRARHRRAGARAAAGRPPRRDGADGVPERVCWALDRQLPRHTGRPHPHLPPARPRSQARTRGRRPARSHHAHALHSPYWWVKCAVGVEQRRRVAGAQVPRVPGVADHAATRVGRLRRPRPQPGARQEPGRLREKAGR